MELDFDKEIDALLRQTVKSDAAFANGNPQTTHLDADEISAFAENALPEKAKQRLTAHFADCDSCRKNLSELILLNGKNEVETVDEEKAAVIAPAIPWYRKLFVFPNLAYTMGALVLAFTGLTAFIVLQNFSGLNSEIASSKNTSIDRTGSAPVQSEQLMPAAANTNSAASNTAPAATTNSAANLSPQSSPEILSNSSTNDKDADRKQMPKDSNPANLSRDESDLDSVESNDKPSLTGGVPLNQPEPENKRENPIVAESRPAPKSVPAPAKRTNEPGNTKNGILTERSGGKKAKDDDKIKEETQGATSLSKGRQRQISGKTFNQRDGVWYDSAYRNQPTTNVRRGTNEYRSLDSGLRSITDKLDGVVVILWKEKAYRIQ